MRILMTTLGSEGHLRPLLPFADAFRNLGHDVLIAIPESGAERVHGAGHDAWELADPPAAAVESVFSRAQAAASPDEANAIVVGEAFAGVYARASLPGVMAATAEWLPDVLMHETCEFAAALTAERAGMPSVRVAVHMRELERYIAELAAPEIDVLRAEHGLAADPDGERLSSGPSVTLTPPALDGRRDTHYRELQPALTPPPGPWDGDDRPLVYLSYGTVAPKGDAYPSDYQAAIEQLAALDVRVLLNTGRQDPASLGALPAGVHAERWVHEAAVLPHVAAMISHGGAGSVRTALTAGVPLAVLPRFGDQPLNARAVEAAGAGLVVADTGRLRSTVSEVLEDHAYRRRAAEIAAEVAALPPVADSIEILRRAT